MHARTPIVRGRPAALLGAIAGVASGATAQCDPGWIHAPGSGFAGTDGTVLASVMWDPDGAGPEPEWLFVGGMFHAAGDIPASAIAAWDGRAWHDLGGGVTEGSIFDRVSSLAVYDGMLIVGGHFAKAGGIDAQNIAAFDGTGWHALGQGVYGGFPEPEVEALTVYGGRLIAGGAFTDAGDGPANFVAAWDGEAWSALGPGADFEVSALATFGGELYVGGFFQSVGGGLPGTQYIARWNGSGWQGAAGGANNAVRALYNDGSSLLVGGTFTQIGNAQTRGIARWDGTQYEPVGGGVQGAVAAIGGFAGGLYAGGQFNSAGGVSAKNIARWDAGGWQALAGGVGGVVDTLTPMDGRLFVGGGFRSADGQPVEGVAFWDGDAWSALEGQSYAIFPGGMAVFGDDLIASGYKRPQGGGRNSVVTRFDGRRWETMGEEFDELVLDLEEVGGELYAFGWFTHAGVNDAPYLARWTGSEWVGVGPGFGGGYVTSVLSVGEYGGELIVGGDFEQAGGVAANHIARWDGGQWAPLGDGLGDDFSFVWGLVEYGDDLVAVGMFGSAGGQPASNAARWDGARWSALGTGLTGGLLPEARAAVVFGGDLIVGGDFAVAGGVAAANVARWDGAQWHPMGAGIPEHGVTSLAVYNGRLYAGGQFDFSDESDTRFMVWDGAAWQRAGVGVNGGVGQLQPFKTELFLTGGFTVVGAFAAPGLARWSDDRTPWFAAQPAGGQACLGAGAVLSGSLATGYEDAALRWRRDGVALEDGPTGWGSVLVGSDTGELMVSDVHAPDAGVYDLVADNGCVVVESEPAELSVCAGDYDCSGAANTLDVLEFLNDWNAGDSHADMNGDGATDTLDVLAFLNAWNMGC